MATGRQTGNKGYQDAETYLNDPDTEQVPDQLHQVYGIGEKSFQLARLSDLVVEVASIVSDLGQPNGIATLDGGGKVPSAQLPSYVDDVLEYADFASLPGTGETGKIYVTIDDNKTYRWSGSMYVEVAGGGGVTDHGNLDAASLLDDDHTQYVLADGTRAFTGAVGGVDPVAASDLATKNYVDNNAASTFLDLTDTPASYPVASGIPTTNGDQDALVFYSGFWFNGSMLRVDTAFASTSISTGSIVTNGGIGVADRVTATEFKCVGGTHINEFSTDETLSGKSDLAVPTERTVDLFVRNLVSASSGVGTVELTFPTMSVMNDLEHGSGRWVVVGATAPNGGTTEVYISKDDGLTWATAGTPHGVSGNMRRAFYIGSTWYVTGDNSGTDVSYRSTDGGDTWTAWNLPNGNFFGLAGNGSRLVALEQNGNVYYSDDDGDSWTANGDFGATSTSAEPSVVWTGSEFVAAYTLSFGSAARFRTSSDGITWSSEITPTPASTGFVKDAAFGNGVYLCVASSGGTFWSTDMVSFNYVQESLTDFDKVAFGDGVFLITDGNGNKVSLTTSGKIDEKTNLNPAPLTPSVLAYGGSKFIAANSGNSVWVSV